MPNRARYRVYWSAEIQQYEIQGVQTVTPVALMPGNRSWFDWLEEISSFAFFSRAGVHCTVRKEHVQRGNTYWYGYRFLGGRTVKRYLGKTADLSIARLEMLAQHLASGSSSQRQVSLHRKNADLLVSTSPSNYLRIEKPDTEPLTPLLSSRLSYPRLPISLVTRERLLSSLEDALSSPLTLLSASAGWGKTTLLATWTSKQRHRVAWLSLDKLDNTLTQFWNSVIAALRTCLPDIGEEALAMLRLPRPVPLFSILIVLLNELASTPIEASTPTLLILDDYQVIENQAIHESLTFLIDHLPPHLRLVLSSRVDPALPLSRWRVQGQMAEIRAEDLRFSAAEAINFLRQLVGEKLAEEDILQLEQRTDGWIAGLQLAGLAMRQRENISDFVLAFSGSHRYVLDYILDEILMRQPSHVQNFLLQIAILPRLNAPLCEAITQEERSQQMLEWLERNNLFVVSLDEKRQWYRLHDLFREGLLAYLQTNQPELLPHLHQRASHWYETQGEWREAIAHALEARDFSSAASLMEKGAPQVWISGEAEAMSRWILALPETILREHLRLATTTALHLHYCTSLLVETRWLPSLLQIENILTRVEEMLNSEEDSAFPESEKELICQRINQIRRFIQARDIIKEGNRERLQVMSQELINSAQEDEPIWALGSFYISFILHEAVPNGRSLLPALLNAKRRAQQAQNVLVTASLMTGLARTYLGAGQLRLGYRESVKALDLFQQVGGYLPSIGSLHLCRADIFYRWNRLKEAWASLEAMFQYANAWQDVDLLTNGYFLRMHILLATDRLLEAQQMLQKLQRLVYDQGFTYQHGLMMRAQVAYWLKQGNLASASNWAARLPIHEEALDFSNMNSRAEQLLLARLYLAQQQYMLAAEVLKRIETALEQQEDPRTLIDVLVLLASALYSVGEKAEAQQVALCLLHLTEQEDYIRVYLDAGHPMKQVLQSLINTLSGQDSARSIAFISKLLAAFEQEEIERSGTLHSEGAHPSPAPSTPSLTPQVMPALLTRREQEVLRLLASGASNHDIARQLVISLATAKKHVSNLIGKLGVRSRAQAIVRAHEEFYAK